MFQLLLAKIATVLDGAGIPYMIIGGQAVLVHGEPRLTRDIDVSLGVESSSLPAVRALAASAGWKPAVDDVETFVRRTNVLPLLDPPTSIRIDLIFSFTPYETQAIARAKPVVLAGSAVRVASAEDLVIHKLVAGRPRDIEDVRGILRRQPALDLSYLEAWLASFSEVVGRDLLKQLESVTQEG